MMRADSRKDGYGRNCTRPVSYPPASTPDVRIAPGREEQKLRPGSQHADCGKTHGAV